MQLRSVTAGSIFIDLVIGVRIEQFREISAAWTKACFLAFFTEAREVENVAVEGDDLQLAGFCRQPVDVPPRHHQIGGPLFLDDAAALGQIGHDLGAVAAVIDDKPEQVAVFCAAAKMERDAFFRAGEFPRLQDRANEVGTNLHHIALQGTDAFRLNVEIHEGNENGNHGRKQHQGAGEAPLMSARGRHYDQFTIAVETVQRMYGGNQQGNGQDERREIGDRQGRHLGEDDEALPLVGHQIELFQRGRDPHDRGERGGNHHQRHEGLAEHVSAEEIHRFPCSHAIRPPRYITALRAGLPGVRDSHTEPAVPP